jgi:membrane fusion protein (multidrug efflux system)
MKDRIYIFILFSLAVAALALSSCSNDGQANEQVAKQKAFAVKTLNVQPRLFNEYLQITGTSKARNQIDIIVEEGGTLKNIYRDKGRYVYKGDTIAVLENLVIKATYDESVAGFNQVKLDYDSKQVLYNKKAISENEFLSAKYQMERAKAGYELAKARYSKLFITAPINGYINDRYYDYGAYIMPMTSLFNLVDSKKLKIRAGVAERFLSDIRIGTPAEIRFDAFPDLFIQSEVSFISKSINPDNRTFEIEIDIANPEGTLAPQMIADIRLLRRSYQDKIVIPLDALIESEAGRHVFISTKTQAVKKTIEVLAVYEDSVLVEGLQANQELIVLGQRELSDGDHLEIIESYGEKQ